MSEKNNAICGICGKPYKICRTCQEIKSFLPWRTVTDTIQHYAIWLALSEYTNTKDKEKAKDALMHCDLSELNTFKHNIQEVINEIITEPVIKVISDEQQTIQKITYKKNKSKENTGNDNDVE